MDKQYKVISVKVKTTNTLYYFQSIENNSITFCNDIDQAMNFSSLDKEGISDYLSVICNKLCMGIKSNVNIVNILDFEILYVKMAYDVEKISYVNEEFEKLKGVSKLSKREIELLGLEDYGLLLSLQNDNNMSDLFDLSSFNTLSSYIDNSSSSIEETITKQLKGLIK